MLYFYFFTILLYLLHLWVVILCWLIWVWVHNTFTYVHCCFMSFSGFTPASSCWHLDVFVCFVNVFSKGHIRWCPLQCITRSALFTTSLLSAGVPTNNWHINQQKNTFTLRSGYGFHSALSSASVFMLHISQKNTGCFNYVCLVLNVSNKVQNNYDVSCFF